MKKAVMLLCTLCLAVPMFAQEFTDDQLTTNDEIQAISAATAATVAPLQMAADPGLAFVAAFLVAHESDNEASLFFKKDPNFSKRQELKNYLKEELKTLNDSTPLERIVHLIIAGDVASLNSAISSFANPSLAVFINKCKYFSHLIEAIGYESRDMVQNASMYYTMKKVYGTGHARIRERLLGTTTEPTEEQLKEIMGEDNLQIVEQAMFDMWTLLDEEKINYEEEPEEVADVFLSFLQDTKDEQ